MEITVDLSLKTQNRSTIGICSTTPGYLSKGCHITTVAICASVFTAGTIYNSCIVFQPRCLLTLMCIPHIIHFLCVHMSRFNHKNDVMSFVGNCILVEIIKLTQTQDICHVFSDLWFPNVYINI